MSEDQAGRRRHILYIDDDQVLCRLIERDLRRNGYSVRCSHDGASGIAAATEEKFDAIVLDHYMPGHDGLSVLPALHALPDAPPVIYVTGADESRVAVSALKAGAVDYVMKDVEGGFMVLLRSAIEQAVEQVNLRRDKDRAEAEVRAARDRYLALSERQAVMLREVNHRVANSLQLISALITMQASRVQDAAARSALESTRDRVHAVAQIHKRLYTSDDVEFVAIDQYLKGLLDELQSSVQISHHTAVELSADPLEIETDKAVSIGVIITELVINAYKYAYPDGRPGAIRVLLKSAEGRIRLVVEDDGIGFAAGATSSGSGLGTRIVNLMAKTLNSSVERDTAAGGTRWVLSFS